MAKIKRATLIIIACSYAFYKKEFQHALGKSGKRQKKP
jgi:hypothetical protein